MSTSWVNGDAHGGPGGRGDRGTSQQQAGGSLGTAVLAVILVGRSFQATFWWSVAFTALAVLPAAMLPGRASGAAGPGAPGA